jgi:hypothetical protein
VPGQTFIVLPAGTELTANWMVAKLISDVQVPTATVLEKACPPSPTRMIEARQENVKLRVGCIYYFSV